MQSKPTLLSICSLLALAGAPAGAQVIDWLSAVDENWNTASNWFGANVPDAAIEDAHLGLVGPYTVTTTNSFSLGGMTISNPNATLAIGQSLTHTLAGNLMNQGVVFVNQPGSGFDAILAFSSNATIDGTGSILLNAVGNPADARIASNGPLLWHSFGHLIHGSGQISGFVQNDSDIIADDPAGAGLRILGTMPQTTNGRLIADSGTLFLGNGSVVAGGEITSLNGGKVEVQTSSTIGALTNSGDLGIPGQGWSLHLNDLLTNNGTITINSNSNTFNAHLWFDVATHIQGNGNIQMVSLGDLADAQILTQGAFSGTIGPDQTVEGSGLITGSNAGVIFNTGTIIANDPLVGLGLAGNHDGGGMYLAEDGRLILRNGLVLHGGTFDSSGSGIVETDHNQVSTLSNVTNLGQMGIVGQGGRISLNGPMTNNGTLTINSNMNTFNAHLRFDSSTSINGNGLVHMISLGDLGDAQLYTLAATEGTIGANQTVDGSGIIDGRDGGTIINNGTINGNHVADGKTLARMLDLRGIHDGQGVGVYRSDDGILGLGNGLVLQNGIFNSSGVGIVEMTTPGLATLSDVTNLGEMGIHGQGGILALTGPITNNGTVTINSNLDVFNAHIRFDNALAALNGTGTTRLQVVGDLGDAQMFTGGEFSAMIGSGQTVAGSGLVDGRSNGTIINNGVINGDDPAFALELRGNHSGVGGGVYRSDNGLLGLGHGLILDGGTFDTSGTGIAEMTVNGLVTLSNVTNLGEMGIRGQGGIVALTGPMTNDGVLTINSDNAVFNAHLRFDSDTTIDGTGMIRMQVPGSLGDAQIFTNGVFSGTIGANQTVAGSGFIDGRAGGTIVNNGTINGDDLAFMLRLNGNHDGSGGGVYRSDDGTLGLANGFVLTGGTFESSGSGIIDMVEGGVAMLSGVTNNGTMGIRGQGGLIGLSGPLTNNGTIRINSNDNVFNAHIRFFAETEIDGTGTINMELAGNFGDAQILNDQGFVGTIGAGQTITGSGLIVGEMNMDGTFNPSSDERRFDIDTTNFSASSGMVADLGGLLAGEFDRLTIGNSQTVTLDGSFIVQLDEGYTPAFGDTWDILSGGTINGEFADEQLPVAGFGQVYRVIYESGRVYVILTCGADLTGDNETDFFDVSTFLEYYGVQDPRADLDLNGQFDFFDVALFLELFGNGCDE